MKIIFVFIIILGFGYKVVAQNYTGFIESGLIQYKDSSDIEVNSITTNITTTSINFSIHTIHGFTFNRNPNFFIGAGVGYDRYKDFVSIPYYLSIRAAFFKSGFSFPIEDDFHSNLYFLADIGKSNIQFDEINVLDSKVKGGLYINTGIGVLLSFVKYVGLNCSVGYKIQQFVESVSSGNESRTNINSLNYKMGVIVRFN